MRTINKVHVKPVSELAEKLRSRIHVPVLSFGSVIGFGKHKGETLYMVIVNDVDYVEWMLAEKAIAIDEPAYAFYLDNLAEATAKKTEHNRQYIPQPGDLPF
jgi:hypothetical protein